MNRTLFNNPIRKDVAEEIHPDKIHIDGFKEEIVDNFDTYKQNMLNLKGAAEPKYIEDWIEQYLTWLDVKVDSSFSFSLICSAS